MSQKAEKTLDKQDLLAPREGAAGKVTMRA